MGNTRPRQPETAKTTPGPPRHPVDSEAESPYLIQIRQIRERHVAETSSAVHFGDQLITRVRTLGNPLCVGLDPYLDKIPPLFRDGPMTPAGERTAPAVGAFLTAVVDRLEGRVAIVKPQSAFFERMGWRGIKMLDQVVRHAHDRGLLVLMDAKRGDIGSTATAYAEAYLADDAPMRSEALTISPFLGRDTLEPYLTVARDNGTGVFILVKTSNPGSGDYQDLKIGNQSLSERIAGSLGGLSDNMRGPETGWSSLGIVVGATYPKQGELLREILPNVPFLIPGYGAQGGGADDAIRTFVPGPNGPEGGIVNSSRAVLFPGDGETEDAGDWESAIDGAVDQAVDGLREALARRG
jgi:orotidine-5'-phosphate decarboxylase